MAERTACDTEKRAFEMKFIKVMKISNINLDDNIFFPNVKNFDSFFKLDFLKVAERR